MRQVTAPTGTPTCCPSPVSWIARLTALAMRSEAATNSPPHTATSTTCRLSRPPKTSRTTWGATKPTKASGPTVATAAEASSTAIPMPAPRQNPGEIPRQWAWESETARISSRSATSTSAANPAKTGIAIIGTCSATRASTDPISQRSAPPMPVGRAAMRIVTTPVRASADNRPSTAVCSDVRRRATSHSSPPPSRPPTVADSTDENTDPPSMSPVPEAIR